MAEHSEDIRPNPETQSDPPRTPTAEEQHEDEFPDVSAGDIEERVEGSGDVDQGGHGSGRAPGGSSDD